MQRGGDQMIQETIKAVKEAEAKAQQKIKDASVRAQSIVSEAEKEAELTDQRYSSKDVLKAMKDAIGGERVV